MKRFDSKIGNNRMGKITVKHFINKTLKEAKKDYIIMDEKGNHIDTTPPFYPLYVKITFQRATTQLRSLINLDFTSVEEAVYYGCGDLMEMESIMINDIVVKEFKKLGSKFSLRGINEKCKPYSFRLDEFFSDALLIKAYNNVVIRSRSPYMRLLIWKSNKIPASVYYDAASKLLGEVPELFQLNEKFIIFGLFEKAISKSKIGKTQVIEWLYGDAKERFSQKALESGLSFNEVVKVVTAIDEQIKKIE